MSKRLFAVLGAAFITASLCGWWRYLKHGSLWVMLSLALVGSAEAEGQQFPLKPDGAPPCNMYWDNFAQTFNVYLKNTKTGTYIKIGSVPTTLTGTPSQLSVPCPLTPGQYYWTVRAMGFGGIEGPEEVAFVIYDPTKPTFAIGTTILTTAYLNVRKAAGATQPLVCPTCAQPKNSPGVLTGGPIAVGGQRWWAISYASGVTGWSSELYLMVAP